MLSPILSIIFVNFTLYFVTYAIEQIVEIRKMLYLINQDPRNIKKSHRWVIS